MTRLGQLYRVKYLQKYGKTYGGEKVIEIGCHDGRMLSEINAGLRVGLDIEPRKSAQDIALVKADGFFTPLRDRSFDVIYLLDVVEHVKDDQKLVSEMLRILKPGGKLILTTPHINIRLFPPFLTSWISIRWGHVLRRGYSVEQLRSLVNQESKVEICELQASWYRKLYLLLKILFFISPKLTGKLLDILLTYESKDPYGSNGFLLLELTK
ncbi:MAG TPA: class I SAM-dependent methyltransferase [Brevefilum sp.]|nr:class I SAM-dependent methyltransferase [Brevefilum sp.]HOR19936.1 class I SAM-dependent methyltransferase [Brevefilum sp.]HPL69579.1 class I SAM-dependent methyltransferase [Brevefilum sp.]